ncbi:nucleotidyl transferase AbiEii/AbiGii toxin family protein [Deminuibacter soli]|uniref:Nucleotidyl transferase AbiEii/AbiGii toxin family protein n=1 Tax=Deminuibacter soli TaxID=2291815 RepID=A0A3E1NKL1_9BACT|nr:nucleotidyl transferase AbiEii/AbiGii toxin family protein [Deminuibacter soli]RFM28452.1 nucleotidyl transferase AbiEii/AbiGii toxin family protein [Deminuibacter soli]
MIKEWLETYNPTDREEATAALREIMQEVALAGLSRSEFYGKAAFYGGTALRIFYGLNRYSEDLDFSLLQQDDRFSFQPYLDAIVGEFNAQGMQVAITEKVKTAQSDIESAFLKSETIWKELVLESIVPEEHIQQVARIKIKIEVDKKPPLGFSTEEKLLTRPFSFYVKCFSLPDLFAGKMHALLFRQWKTNVKGRDWYDMEWYIKRGTSLNLNHFLLRAKGSGSWKEDTITEVQFRALLQKRIDNVDLNRAKEDISRFIKDQKVLEIWSPKYFHDLVEKMKIV